MVSIPASWSVLEPVSYGAYTHTLAAAPFRGDAYAMTTDFRHVRDRAIRVVL